MIAKPPLYLAYMLRLWQVGGESDLIWRISLQSAYNGERLLFADLDALFAFLKEKTGLSEEHEAPSRHPAASRPSCHLTSGQEEEER